MNRQRKHIAGAVVALAAALGLLVPLYSAIERGSTRATIVLMVLIVVCTLAFVVEIMLAATAKPVKAVLKTAEMRTPDSLPR